MTGENAPVSPSRCATKTSKGPEEPASTADGTAPLLQTVAHVSIMAAAIAATLAKYGTSHLELKRCAKPRQLQLDLGGILAQHQGLFV